MKFDVYVIQPKLETFYLEAIREYEKRLTRYGKAQLHLLKDDEQLKSKDAGGVLKILVTQTEPSLSSETFAEKVDRWGISGISQVAFTIGADVPQADERLTISRMAMEPGLLATVLFEQLYRAFCIIHNHPYHK